MPLSFIETVCELNLENPRFYSIWLYKENLESSEVHKIHYSQSLLTNIALKLICKSSVTKTQHKRTAVASMFYNGISRNSKCAKRDSFCRQGHIYI